MKRLWLLCIIALCGCAGALSTPSTVSKQTILCIWTAVGDSGTGAQATKYDMRRSNDVDILKQWKKATQIKVPFTPKPAGGVESCYVSVPLNQAQYLGIKVCDKAGNWSNISNIAYYDPSKITTVLFKIPN